MSNRRAVIVALTVGLSFAPACNSLTGVDDLHIGSSDPAAPALVAVPGVAFSEIALYQAVKRPLMAGGRAATSAIPIVAGREALLRVFVTTDASYTGKPVTAQLFLDDEKSPPIEVTGVLSGSSTDAELESTLNFNLPGDKITPETQYRVVLGEPAGDPRGATAPAYPANGWDPIPAESVGAQLKLMIAPIAYGANGRLPDLTEKQIQMYTDRFHAMYPAPKVEITIRSKPIEWTQPVGSDGDGWSELLDHVANVRQEDKVGKDVYYFAPFEPEMYPDDFCKLGCVLGLGLLAEAGDDYARAAIGLGYGGGGTGVTALHEIGHTHGRLHAPCQTEHPDPDFPHAGGEDGVWGYNLVTNKLFPPTTTDIMGYCSPSWISDYTYKGLFDRIKFVNGAKVIIPEEARNRVYDRVLVDAAGAVKWLAPIRLETPPRAEARSLVVESKGAAETVTGAFYRFDHLEGGILFWPSSSERATTAIRLEVAAGKTVRLRR